MRRSLPAESDLIHQVLVVQEQPLMIHLAVLPVTDRHHPDCEALTRRLNHCSIGSGHRLRESAGHHASGSGPTTRPKANGMNLDLDIGAPYKHRFEVLDVLFNSLRFVTVGPSHDDVLSMTFLQTFPLLVADHIEVERMKLFK